MISVESIMSESDDEKIIKTIFDIVCRHFEKRIWMKYYVRDYRKMLYKRNPDEYKNIARIQIEKWKKAHERRWKEILRKADKKRIEKFKKKYSSFFRLKRTIKKFKREVRNA